MSAELETIGAASASSGVIAFLVVIIRDLIKNRNGNNSATKADINNLSTKLSADIKGVYDKIDEMKQGCFERHIGIADKLSGHNARIESMERGS